MGKNKSERIKELLNGGGLGIREIARQVGCSPSLVVKVKKRGEQPKSKEKISRFVPYTPPNMG